MEQKRAPKGLGGGGLAKGLLESPKPARFARRNIDVPKDSDGSGEMWNLEAWETGAVCAPKRSNQNDSRIKYFHFPGPEQNKGFPGFSVFKSIFLSIIGAVNQPRVGQEKGRCISLHHVLWEMLPS